MTTTEIGRRAEDAACAYLRARGYQILDRNWRTRWCEIDIVCRRDGVVSFVEVKYRFSSRWGSGVEYITPQKLRQMRFAAEFWLSRHAHGGSAAFSGCNMYVASVSGSEFVVDELLYCS